MSAIGKKLKELGVIATTPDRDEAELQELVARAKEAQSGAWAGLSTSEQLATAFILNRPDWITNAGYTLAAAIRQVGPDWLALVPDAADALRNAR